MGKPVECKDCFNNIFGCCDHDCPIYQDMKAEYEFERERDRELEHERWNTC